MEGQELEGLAWMEAVLTRESVGHMGLAAAGEVYVVPINYTYSSGRVLFHCSLEGRKLDMIRANPQVCFEVSVQHSPPIEHLGETCHHPFESVICWGEARIVEDLEERAAILQEFQARYATPDNPRTSVKPERVPGCGVVEIRIHRMTGRQVGGSFEHGGGRSWEWDA
jgi:uncharacterized protein